MRTETLFPRRTPSRLGALILCLAMGGAAAWAGPGSGFNTPGNLLIADQFNNRVIEVDPATSKIVWSYGTGSIDATTKGAIVAPNDALRVGTFTLISGTGAPAGSPNNPDGSQDNRVLLVDQGGHIAWQYGQAAVAGSGPGQLSVRLHSGRTLISDQFNDQVLEVDRPGMTVRYTLGMINTPGVDPAGHPVTLLNGPYDAKEIGDYLGLTPPFDFDEGTSND